MPKVYQPFTIKEFGTLRFTSTLDRAAMADNEAAQLDNYNFTEMKTLTKRLGWQNRQNNFVSTNTLPAGGTVIQPGNVRMLGLQRRSPTGSLANKYYFTNATKTGVWTVEDNFVGNQFNLVTPTNQQLDGAEWLVAAATPAFPYQMQLCRSTGGMVGINVGGVPTAFTGSPAGTHMSLFKSRLFMINSLHTSGQESRLNFSEPLDYGNWPAANNIDISPADGEFLVATVVFNDQLILFKNRSTYVLTADGAPTSWIVRKLHPTIGCVGRGTPIIISGFIYFCSADGVYRTDGTTFERISEPIDGLIKSRLFAYQSNMVLNRDAVFYDDKYILMLPDGFGSNIHLFVYDVRVDQWSRWVMGSGVETQGFAQYQEASPSLLVSGAKNSNKLFSMGNPIYADDSTAYQCNFVSKAFDGGDPTSYKRNYAATVEVGANSNEAGSAGVQVTLQKETTESSGGTHAPTSDNVGTVNFYDLNRKSLRYPGIGLYRYIGISINNLGTTKVEVFGFTLLNGEPKQLISKST